MFFVETSSLHDRREGWREKNVATSSQKSQGASIDIGNRLYRAGSIGKRSLAANVVVFKYP